MQMELEKLSTFTAEWTGLNVSVPFLENKSHGLVELFSRHGKAPLSNNVRVSSGRSPALMVSVSPVFDSALELQDAAANEAVNQSNGNLELFTIFGRILDSPHPFNWSGIDIDGLPKSCPTLSTLPGPDVLSPLTDGELFYPTERAGHGIASNLAMLQSADVPQGEKLNASRVVLEVRWKRSEEDQTHGVTYARHQSSNGSGSHLGSQVNTTSRILTALSLVEYFEQGSNTEFPLIVGPRRQKVLIHQIYQEGPRFALTDEGMPDDMKLELAVRQLVREYTTFDQHGNGSFTCPICRTWSISDTPIVPPSVSDNGLFDVGADNTLSDNPFELPEPLNEPLTRGEYMQRVCFICIISCAIADWFDED